MIRSSAEERPPGTAEVEVATDLHVTTFANRWSAGEAHYLYHEIFTHDDYLGRLPPLRPGSVVVDAGANIGMFGLRVARACPDAHLVAIEPVPRTCALLRRNLAGCGLPDVRIHQVALGERAGRAVLTAYRHLPANSTAHPHEKPAAWTASMHALAADPARAAAMLATDEVEVELVRLSDLLPTDLPVVDLLKIDVEGAELDVLHGLDDADWPRVAQVVVEVQDVGDRPAALLGLLGRRGFTCTVATPAMMADEMGCRLVVARRS